jgi:hypothetical protein
MTWQTLTPPEWLEVSEEQLRRLKETGGIGPYEKEYFRKHGSRRWILFAGRDLGDGTAGEYAIDIPVSMIGDDAGRSKGRFAGSEGTLFIGIAMTSRSIPFATSAIGTGLAPVF